MLGAGVRTIRLLPSALLCACALLAAQQPEQPLPPLNESGQILVNGHSTPYLIRHLPVSSFPDLPAAARRPTQPARLPDSADLRGLRPENVIHASLERAGSSDWAVLCSSRGTVSLLVYFSSDPAELQLLSAAAPETERLQAHDPSGVLGFNWGIDPASPEQVHQAQIGVEPRPPPGPRRAGRLDHQRRHHLPFLLQGRLDRARNSRVMRLPPRTTEKVRAVAKVHAIQEFML